MVRSVKTIRRTRQHNFYDYEPEDDICHDRVKIHNKKDPYERMTGWMGKNYLDEHSFIFEYVDLDSLLSKTEYIREVLSYSDWEVKYLDMDLDKKT
jgi:disulfide oxidoreductase YuzD